MNIANIEAFVYVIHFHSFHKAAEALYLSQPSITARIQSLERELDAKLFERDGRSFTLTEKGKQFLPYAQQILQTYKKGQQQLKQMNTTYGEIRIGCTQFCRNAGFIGRNMNMIPCVAIWGFPYPPTATP